VEPAFDPLRQDTMLTWMHIIPILSKNGGATWDQIYTNSSGIGWQSTGLNEMSVFDLAMDDQGRLLVACADVYPFRGADTSDQSFEWFGWPAADDSLGATTEKVWSVNGGVFYLERSNRDHIGATELVEYDFDAGIATELSDNLDGVIKAEIGYYPFWLADVAFMSDTEVFGICNVLDSCSYSQYPDNCPDTPRHWQSLVVHGQEANGQWTWEAWGDPINGRSMAAVEHLAGSSTLLVAGTMGVYRFDTSDPSITPEIWLDSAGTVGGLSCRFFRCLAQDPLGTVVYAGTRGEIYSASDSVYAGTLLRLLVPTDGTTPTNGDWEVLANRDGDTFGIGTNALHTSQVAPAWYWQPDEHYKRMTYVNEVLVDPRDPDVVYVGLAIPYTHPSNGVWRYSHGNWEQVCGAGESPQRGVSGMVQDVDNPDVLYIGTQGQELFRVSLPELPPVITTYKNRSAAADSNGLSYEGTPYASILLDSDLDGDEDLMMSMQDYPPLLFEKTGVNAAVGVPEFTGRSGDLPVITNSTRGLSSADYDDDGRPDVFLAAEGGSYLLHNDGGTFSVGSDSTFHAQTDHAWAGAWCDENLDGWVDLYVCRASNPDTTQKRPMADATGEKDCFMFNTYGNSFSNMYDFFFPDSTDVEPTFAACWGDVDQDGDPDLFVPSMRDGGVTPSTHMYIHNDDDNFLVDEYGSRFPGIVMGRVTSCQFVDLDSDGDLDLVTTSVSKDGSSLERARVFWNDGQGVFSEDSDALPDLATFAASEARPLDVDLDGLMDLVVCPLDSSQTPRLYRNTGDATGQGGMRFLDVAAEAGLDAAGIVDGAIATDFDGDGDPDLLLGSPKGEYRYYWSATRSDGAESLGRTHLSVRLEDRGSHASNGIGALVWLEDGSGQRLTSAQPYDGGSGRGGQQPPVLRFGLGTRTDPVTIKVRWPGGYGQRIQSMTVDPTVQDTVTVVDDTHPECVDVVATPYMEPGGTVMWVIDWTTRNLSIGDQDRVSILQPDGMEYIAYVGYPQVSHSCVMGSQGSQKHEFIITGRPCIPGNHLVTVFSSNDAYEDYISVQRAVRTCMARQ